MHQRRVGLGVVAAGGALALAVAGTGTAVPAPVDPAPAVAATSATPAATTSIAWQACTIGAVKAQCGNVKVPLDHAKPDGRKITIAVTRVRATAPVSQRLGPLFVNPGGPGGSGLSYSGLLKTRLPAAVSARFDLIGFDPRGVGASRPALSCLPNYAKGPRPSYEPATSASGAVSAPETAWLKRSKNYAAACAANHPQLIHHMRTVDAVRDIDLIRRALGATKLSFFGYSYGTYLAQVYATLYPDRTRRLVLDGVVNAKTAWYAHQLDQDRGFEKVAGRFFGWVASHNGTYGLGSTGAKVRARYVAEQAKLRKTPRGSIGPAEWADAFLNAGYTQGVWPRLASAFKSWVHGTSKPLAGLYAEVADVGNDNGFAVYNAVQCSDARWPRDYATWRRDAFATASAAPFATWGNVWYNTPCIYWAAAQHTPVNVSVPTASALLLTATLDGATPLAGALEARRRIPHAALVVEDGQTTHTVSYRGNACIDSRVSDYLLTGKLPARKSGSQADVTCAKRPLPRP